MTKFRCYFTLFLLSVLGSASYAQFNPTWTSNYQHTNNFNFSNESRKMVKDAGGNTYVIADITSDIDPNGIQSSMTFHYVVLLKYNTSGTLVLSRIVNILDHVTNGFNNKSAFGIAMGSNGSLYTGFTMYEAATGHNVVMSKYNPANLVRIWNYTYKPAGDDTGIDLATGPAGSVYCIAKSGGTYHILKGDTSGTDSTSHFTFDANVDVPGSLVVDNNGDAYVTGYSFIGGIKNALTAGIKNNGSIKFKKFFNGGTIPRDDSGKQIILGTDNNLYIVGTSDRGTPDMSNIMVLTYTANTGKFRWVNYFDYNDGLESGVLIKQADAGNIYAAGTSGNRVFITRFETNIGTYTGYSFYDPVPIEPHNSLNGVTLSQIAVSAAKNIYLYGHILANDVNNQPFSATFLSKFAPEAGRINGMLAFKFKFAHPVVGTHADSYTSSDMYLDAAQNRVYTLRDHIANYSNHADEEVSLVAYNVPTPLRLSDDSPLEEVKGVMIAPNPARDYFEIVTEVSIRQITLTDYSGRIVINEKANSATSMKVSVTGLNRGMYFLEIIYDDGTSEISKILRQ